MTLDVVITGARLVDGGGGPSRLGLDVGIRYGRIAAIGTGLSGRRTVEADGLVLAPGFIDMHAHSDLALLADPAHTAKLAQGVTLEVVGQDGLSYAPVDETTLPQIRQAITGWNGDGADVDLNWRTVGGYLDRLDEGVALNAAYLVPHGAVRMLVLGWEDRPATEPEIGRMRQLVAEGLEQGAVGLSAGLTYAPGMYADDAELTALCEVLARYDGYFCPHHRSYGAGALTAYAQMIALCKASGCALHLAHATLNFPTNQGRSAELLGLLDAALADGVDLSLDTYPYLPGCTTLAALLPSWAAEGGPDATMDRLRDPASQLAIQHALEVTGSDGCHGVPVDWRSVEVSGVADTRLSSWVGHRLESFEQARTLLLDDRLGTTILQHVGDEENVQAIMRHRVHTGGSDGILRGGKPHPRAYGTFPRYLGVYVRELGVLSLEECVAHLTSRPAARLRLPDRGLVREGYRADLVLFDPDTVAAGATYAEPRTPPSGIPYVWVNGELAMEDGRRTQARAGRSVRRRGLAR